MMRAAAVLALALLPGLALACGSSDLGALTLSDPWARATLGADRPAVVYLEIANHGSQGDALTAISAPIARMAMLHHSTVTEGRASMAHVARVPLPAGQVVRLEPAGFHAMLTGLDGALKPGDSFPLTLRFARAGTVTLQVPVLAMSATGPGCGAAD